MRRATRSSLILVLSIGLSLSAGLTAPALAQQSAQPVPTITVPLAYPTPSQPPHSQHTWAKNWARQAAKNRHPLIALGPALGRRVPAMPGRPQAGASDRRWSRYGRACRASAGRFVRLSKCWHQLLRDPVTLGRYLAAKRGWTGSQWAALYRLWANESGWRVTAANPSGAYGIPQALPGSKMGSGWQTSAGVQIRWGLSYIKARYGTPVAALAHQSSSGWY